MKLVICLATAGSIPCLILMTCRAWPSGDIRLSFFHILQADLAFGQLAHGNLRQGPDFKLVLGREFDLILFQNDFGFASLEIETVGQFLFGLDFRSPSNSPAKQCRIKA
jgi:hypothetical protein